VLTSLGVQKGERVAIYMGTGDVPYPAAAFHSIGGIDRNWHTLAGSIGRIGCRAPASTGECLRLNFAPTGGFPARFPACRLSFRKNG
jgi:hypothetical protein